MSDEYRPIKGDDNKYYFSREGEATLKDYVFDNVYPTPEEFTKTYYAKTVITEKDGEFCVYTLNKWVKDELTGLSSLDAVYKMMSKSLFELSTHNFNSTVIHPFFNRDRGYGYTGVGLYDNHGNILIEDNTNSGLKVIADDTIVYKPVGEDYWLVKNIQADIDFGGKIDFRTYFSEGLFSFCDYNTNLGTLYDLKRNKYVTKEGAIFEKFSDSNSKVVDGLISVYKAVEDWDSLNVNEAEVAVVTQADMKLHEGLYLYDERLGKLWELQDNIIKLVDLATGVPSVVPYPVAKSLGCTLTL